MARLRKLQMARWARGRRRVSAPVSVLAIAVVAVTTVALTCAFTGALSVGSGATGQALTRQQAAQRILKTQAAQVMTAPAQAALRMQATGSKDLSPGLSLAGISVRRQSGPATGGGAQAQPAFSNVRVNDPSLDTHEPDQTTQSETSIAVAGSHVAVGYNDSQQTGLALTAGSNLTGYSYSADGGASFTDGGTIPNTPEFVNFGDPWLASTRAGDMYYSTLALDLFNFNLDVVVAKSTDGGKTFGTPVPVFRPPFSIFYNGDKPALATGPDPAVKACDNLYAAWDDFSFNTVNGKFFTGLPVASSTDGGKTFGPGVRIAGVIEAVPDDLLFLGPGKYMRDLEFPAIALRGKSIYVAWNDGALGRSHIRLARSTNGGQTWRASFVTTGALDEVQPALSADGSGVHLLYYQRNPNNTLDVLVGNSKNGIGLATKRVTTQSFAGTLTIPQFDPIIAFGYMGDYIANVSDGSHQYFAWGDNRDSVTDFLYPNGRSDPDVFFARQ